MGVDRVKELVQEGLRRRLSGDLRGAIEAWAEVLLLDPDNARAREGLAELGAAGATPSPAAPPAEISNERHNPFARPFGPAPLNTTPSPFSAVPTNATPLSMVIPRSTPPEALPARPETPISMAAPLTAKASPAPPVPEPARPAPLDPPEAAGTLVFGLAGDPGPGEPPGQTMVFGMPQPGQPPLTDAPFAPGQTMVFGMDVPAPPAAAPGQTQVFGLDLGTQSADPAQPPPELSQTLVFGLAVPGSPPVPFAVGAPAPQSAGVTSDPLESLDFGEFAAGALSPVARPDLPFGAATPPPAAAPFFTPSPFSAPPAQPWTPPVQDPFARSSVPPATGPLRPTLTPPSGFDFPVESPSAPVVRESEPDEEITFEVPTPTPPPIPAAAPAAPAPAAPAPFTAAAAPPPEPTPAAPEPVPVPDEPGALLLKAIDLLDLDDYSGAMAAVGKVLAIDPGNATAQELKARCETTLLTMYESKLGDLTGKPAVRLKPDEVVWLNLDHRAGFLLSLIDGQVSYEDVFALSSMSRVETAKILLDLIGAKVIG